ADLLPPKSASRRHAPDNLSRFLPCPLGRRLRRYPRTNPVARVPLVLATTPVDGLLIVWEARVRRMTWELIEMTRMMAPMKPLPARTRHAVWIAATLLLAALPAAAQVVTTNNGQLQVNAPGGQQLSATHNSQAATSSAPTTGTFCIEEMTATFCNVPTGPNTNGYGSVGGVSTSGGGSSSGSTASAGTGVNTSSLPPCMREPAANELCN